MGRAAAVVGGAVRGDAAQLRYFSLNSPITLNSEGLDRYPVAAAKPAAAAFDPAIRPGSPNLHPLPAELKPLAGGGEIDDRSNTRSP
jgi:hypothetical protein